MEKGNKKKELGVGRARGDGWDSEGGAEIDRCPCARKHRMVRDMASSSNSSQKVHAESQEMVDIF